MMKLFHFKVNDLLCHSENRFTLISQGSNTGQEEEKGVDLVEPPASKSSEKEEIHLVGELAISQGYKSAGNTESSNSASKRWGKPSPQLEAGLLSYSGQFASLLIHASAQTDSRR